MFGIKGLKFKVTEVTYCKSSSYQFLYHNLTTPLPNGVKSGRIIACDVGMSYECSLYGYISDSMEPILFVVVLCENYIYFQNKISTVMKKASKVMIKNISKLKKIN